MHRSLTIRRGPSRRTVLALACAALLIGSSTAAWAAITFPAQGHLATTGGGPVADGSYVITCGIYESEAAADPIWKEIHIAVQVAQGLFFIEVGTQDKIAPIPADLFVSKKDLWFGLKVGIEPELPRQRFSRLPYAVHALAADALTGTIDGAQIATGSLPDKALAFSYAASSQKGGAALTLDCTGCITADHIAAGTLDAKTIVYSAGGGVSTVHAELAQLNGALKFDGSQVGVGKAPAQQCGLDVGSDAGDFCIDGSPAMITRLAADDAAMAKLAKDGQVVYRTDQGRFFARVKTKWRKLQFEAVCGDGEVDPPEQCDDADKNADAPDACRTTCASPLCGDQIVDSGEQCDDGNIASNDACITCKSAICGDGNVQLGVEECDDGPMNADKADACRNNCKKPVCGDKIVDSGEQCDDGNTNGGDACPKACKAVCSDGVCDALFGESFATCVADCPKPPLWFESTWTSWYGIKYPHSDYKESKAIAACKAVGLRLWRDEGGPKADPDWAWDYNNNHNLGGHDIGSKVTNAVSGGQEGHTGSWVLFAKAWSDAIKAATGAANGESVYLLNHLSHTGSNETSASYTIVAPQSNSVSLVQGNQNGAVSGMKFAMVLCAEHK